MCFFLCFADFQRIPKGLLKDYKEAKKGKNVYKNKYRFIYPCKNLKFFLIPCLIFVTHFVPDLDCIITRNIALSKYAGPGVV